MIKPFSLTPSRITSDSGNSKRFSRIECLEARIAPAAVATPATFTYTDGDGDVVQVTISGAAGSAEFLDALGGDVHASGGDLAKIIISKPSPDFSIAFADTNAPTGLGIGDNIIELGKIVGPNDIRLPLIKGIFTADSSPSVSYELGGYYGTDFSAGGGLKIAGKVISDALGATTEVDLKSLAKGASISIASVETGALVRITGKVAGNLSVPVLDGDLSLGIVTGDVQIGQIAGALTLQSDLGGRLHLGEQPTGGPATLVEVSIKGSVLPTGVIYATEDLTLHVTKNLGGSVFTGGSLDAEVSGGMTGARLLIGDDLTLEVDSAVSASSIMVHHTVTVGTEFKKGVTASSIVGGTGLNLDVTGAVTKSTFSAGTGSMDMAISGTVLGSQFLAGGDATLTTGGGIVGTSILPDGRLTLTTGTAASGGIHGVGGVVSSVIGSKSTSAVVNVGGRVEASQFTAGTDLELIAGKTVNTSQIQSANDLTLEVASGVGRTKIAVGSNADVTIGGQFAASSLIVSNNLYAEIGQVGVAVSSLGTVYAGVIGSVIKTSDGSLTLNNVGPILTSTIDSGQHATVNVADVTGVIPGTHTFGLLKAATVGSSVSISAPGDVTFSTSGVGKASPKLTAGNDVAVSIAGAFGGAISAVNDVTFGAKSVFVQSGRSLRVGGDLKFVVAGDAIVPLIDVAGDVKDFRVGGGFAGGVKVSGNFIAGTTAATATVIGGALAPSTLLQLGGVVPPPTFLEIGGDLGSSSSAPEYLFGKGFKGRIDVAGNVVTDLTFNGDVNRIAVGGIIGPATSGGASDAVVDVIVHGRLAGFTSASLFHSTATNGGQFLDAAGTVTGAIQIDIGPLRVGPFIV